MKISWWKPTININNYNDIKKIVKKGWPNQGKFSKLLEKKISKKLKVKYCLTSTSGTSAIYLAVKALKLKKNAEILLPNIAYAAAGNAIIAAGHKVKLLDVDRKGPSICIEDLKKKITKKTKAIIVVHISGRSNNFLKVIKICKKKKIHIIEDAAEALFSKLNNKYLGTVGDIGCFSLSPQKIITSGQGGLLVTNNLKYYTYISRFKNQGRDDFATGGSDTHHHLGFNFKYTDIQAVLALSQLKEVNERCLKLKKNYNSYIKYLKSNNNFFILENEIHKGNIPLWVDCYSDKRNKLIKFLEKFDIPARKFWLPLNTQKEFKTSSSELNNSVLLSKNLMWLPSGFNLSEKQIKFICNKINFFNEKY